MDEENKILEEELDDEEERCTSLEMYGLQLYTILDINYFHFYNFNGISHHKKFLYTLGVLIFAGTNFRALVFL